MEHILAFANTNAAVKAEHLLLAAGLHVGVMPLPGQIRAGCGICLRVSTEDTGAALCILDENGVLAVGLYMKNGNEYTEMTDGRVLWNRS